MNLRKLLLPLILLSLLTGCSKPNQNKPDAEEKPVVEAPASTAPDDVKKDDAQDSDDVKRDDAQDSGNVLTFTCLEDKPSVDIPIAVEVYV